jgi:hypothetical protein
LLALTRRRKMNRGKKIRRWLRTRLKAAGSEGTRYWITRLSRRQDLQYHEMLNETERLRQKVESYRDDLLQEIIKTREGDF